MVSRTACAIQLLLMIALTEDLNTGKYSNPVTAQYSKILLGSNTGMQFFAIVRSFHQQVDSKPILSK